jgi:membrane fusion protein (multidrug efflux system)
MDSKKKKIISIAGTIVVLFVGYLTYEHFAYVTTDNAQIFGHSLMLAPKVSGYITEVNVVEGQKVGKDEVLVQIDPRDYENNGHQSKHADVMLKKTTAAL